MVLSLMKVNDTTKLFQFVSFLGDTRKYVAGFAQSTAKSRNLCRGRYGLGGGAVKKGHFTKWPEKITKWQTRRDPQHIIWGEQKTPTYIIYLLKKK